MNEETKKNIKDDANCIYHIYFPNATNHIERTENRSKAAQKDAYIAGATFGHSLAEAEIQKLKKDFDVMVGNDARQQEEIERRNVLIETMFHTYRDADTHKWQQFKIDNKL